MVMLVKSLAVRIVHYTLFFDPLGLQGGEHSFHTICAVHGHAHYAHVLHNPAQWECDGSVDRFSSNHHPFIIASMPRLTAHV